jgi:inorganic pyrophosphatase
MRVFIENEAGSRRKNTYDELTLRHMRAAEVSAAYPFPYGFVIDTISGDGDAVDCFVITSQHLSSGDTIECDPVGLLEQIEDGEIDHKVIAVPMGASRPIDDVTLAALKHFIANVFAHVSGKRMEIGRLLGREAAEAYLRQCHKGFSGRPSAAP